MGKMGYNEIIPPAESPSEAFMRSTGPSNKERPMISQFQKCYAWFFLWRPILAISALLLGLAGTSRGQEETLENLATQRDYESHRLTSADPKGGNDDSWEIKPGETRVLAELPGPGRIVHFRDNITSDEAHHLQPHILASTGTGRKNRVLRSPLATSSASALALPISSPPRRCASINAGAVRPIRPLPGRPATAISRCPSPARPASP